VRLLYVSVCFISSNGESAAAAAAPAATTPAFIRYVSVSS